MHTTDVPLSPDERIHEIAAILAAGVLRLKTHPESPPPGQPVASGTRTGCSPARAGTTELGACVLENIAEKLSESSRNCLDVSATPRTHVPAV